MFGTAVAVPAVLIVCREIGVSALRECVLAYPVRMRMLCTCIQKQNAHARAFSTVVERSIAKLPACVYVRLRTSSRENGGCALARPAYIGPSSSSRWMAIRGDQAKVAVGWSGKMKTATQMVALQLLLLQ